MKIPIISPMIHYFCWFYTYIGKKMYLLFIVTFLSGLFDGIGISMLLPILDYNKNVEDISVYSAAIFKFLNTIGLGVSLPLLFILFFITFCLKGGFFFMKEAMSARVGTNFLGDLRKSISMAYSKMSYQYFTTQNSGYLNNVVTTEADRAMATFWTYEILVNTMFAIAIYMGASFLINWNVALTILLICIPLFALLRRLTAAVRKYSHLESSTNAEIQSLLIQQILNFKYLKATDSFAMLLSQLFKKIDKNLFCRYRLSVMTAILPSTIEPSGVLLLSLLLLYFVAYKESSIASVLVVMIFSYRAYVKILNFQRAWQKFNRFLGGLEVIKNASKDMQESKESFGNIPVRSFEKMIELNHVSVTFGSKQVLFDINLRIPKGKCVGIVGESGAGKTTIFDVLTGMIVPQAGTVTIDGIDYDKIKKSSLRRRIGYVTQDPVVFNDTIANNITLWECNSSRESCREQLHTAALLANCSSFIRENNRGYEELIGDEGVELSGGQKQRIGIAREFFKNPEIIILDEATSSLDSESERDIQKSINALAGEKTIVIITHRLSAVLECDMIYVMNEGHIVQTGKFSELYKDKDGPFGRMCRIQHLNNSGGES